MSIRYHSSVLITNNIEDMKEFYTEVMGQEVEHDFGGCIILACGLTIWKLDDHYPLNKTFGENIRAGANRGMEVCFETDDFAVESEVMLLKGVKLIHGVEEEQWGQLALRFYDPDENIVELCESMPCFCRRLFRSGLDLADVAKKTGIPTKTVKEYLSV